MEREIHITLEYKLSTGNVNLNEIVYRLKELRDPLLLRILEQILKDYDDLIAERLSRTDIYPSKARKGLGRHIRKNDPDVRFCRGRKVRKKGYRNKSRKISTVFGDLALRIREVECCKCGARHTPLRSALKIDPYVRREKNFEHEVIESVIDTNYRRLIEGRSIDISLGGIHNIVVGSDIDETFHEPVFSKELSAIVADSTGVKQKKGRGSGASGFVLSLSIFDFLCYTRLQINFVVDFKSLSQLPNQTLDAGYIAVSKGLH